MFTSTTWEKSYAHSPWFKRWQHHPNALVKPQMMPLQNTAPYNVWHHDDQGSSTSTQTICLIVWGERHLTVQANSAALLESQKPKIVTDQTVVLDHQAGANWVLWDFWQMFHHKTKEPSNLQAGSQCSRPKHLCSSPEGMPYGILLLLSATFHSLFYWRESIWEVFLNQL